MAPPPPPPPPPPVADEIGFDALLESITSNGISEEDKAAGLPSFAAPETNGVDNSQALVKAPEQKPWEKPLTIPEIRKSSNNWSLASDAGLLLYLQEFSQKMMAKTSDLEKRVDGLVHDTKSADSRVHNTFNDFLMLANTQFIENRVYDDSEEVDGAQDANKEKKDNQSKSREQREAEVIPRVIKALTLGINVLDTGFEHLDANAGNSDSEDEDPTYKAVDPILEAKDLYAHRSLPYIIGTPAFMQDDDVGLVDLSEEEAEEEESSQEDTISDSEKSELSESEYSDTTETESDFTGGGQKRTGDTTVTSTTKSGSEESEGELFAEDVSDEEDILPSAKPKPTNFQDELAAKLGGGVAAASAPDRDVSEPNRNRTISEDSKASSHSSKKGTRRKKLPLDKERKSKKRSTSKNEDDNLFGEQIVQEDGEDEDSPFGKKGGLFSTSGGGLFDDDGEEDGGLFDDKPGGRKEVTSDHVYEDIVAQPEAPAATKPSKKAPPGGVPLFGAGGEDDLFGGSPKSNQEGEQKQKGSASEESGGLFGYQDEDDLFAEAPSKPPPKKEAPKPKAKQVDLFGGDDDSDLFGESKPAAKPQQPPPKKKLPAGAVSVFGDFNPLSRQTEPPALDEGGDEEGAYVNTMVGTPGAGRSKPNQSALGGGLFDSVDEDLFGPGPPRPTEKPGAKTSGDTLFAAEEDDDNLFAAPPPIPKDESKSTAKKSQGLFDDIEEAGEEDFFAASSKPKESIKKKPIGGVALFEGTDIFGSPPKNETPPEVPQKPELSPHGKANRTQNTLSLFNEDDEKDEDLFATPPARPPKIKEPVQPPTSKEEQLTKRRTKSKSIFDDEAILFGLKNEENPGVDLFGTDTPVPQSKDEKTESAGKPRASSSSSGLFGDEDDDDLFGGGSKTATSKATGAKAAAAKAKKKKKSATLPAKGGLFGEEEEDDLFGEPKEKKKAEPKKAEPKKVEPKKAKPKKAEPVKVVDPLGGGGIGEGAGVDEGKETPPTREERSSSQRKKPAGAVSMFGGIDPSSIQKKKQEDDDIMFEAKSPTSPTPHTAPKPAAKPSHSHQSPAPFMATTPPSQNDEPEYAVVTPRIKSVSAPKGKSSSATSRVSSLQTNLVIDPTALRPGAAPPPREPETTTADFDQPAQIKTLDNPTKTRARVSAKRRPPSRRSLQTAASSDSSSGFWADATGDDSFKSDLLSVPSDEPDLGPRAAAAPAPAPKSSIPSQAKAAELPSSSVTEPEPKAKQQKPAPAKPFEDNLFSDVGKKTIASDPLSSGKKETKPLSLDDDGDLFATKPKKETSRTVDNDDDIFGKPPKVNLDSSMDDIFATPPVSSQKQTPAKESDPLFEDIFATGPATTTSSKNNRSTLSDLAIDEDLFGDIGAAKPKESTPTLVDDDLFATEPPPITTTTKPKKKKAAKKAPVLEDDDDLFAEKPARKTKTKTAKATDSDLFADTTDIFADLPAAKPKEKKKKKTTEDSIFKDVKGDDIFAEPTENKPKKTKSKKKTTAKQASDSIFDTDAPNIFDDPLNAINN